MSGKKQLNKAKRHPRNTKPQPKKQSPTPPNKGRRRKKDPKKTVILNLPYIILGLVATNIGEAWRLAEGADLSTKMQSLITTFGEAFSNPMPSLHPLDLCIGLLAAGGFRLAVYLKGKNAKKYRHGVEYGSARWSA